MEHCINTLKGLNAEPIIKNYEFNGVQPAALRAQRGATRVIPSLGHPADLRDSFAKRPPEGDQLSHVGQACQASSGSTAIKVAAVPTAQPPADGDAAIHGTGTRHDTGSAVPR